MRRRTLIQAAGIGVIAAGAASAGFWSEARAARERGDALKTLTPAQQITLEALGEALLPGAREAGIAHFVDAHVTIAPGQSLLTLRYFDWPPPYAAFYAGGLAALDGASMAAHGAPFAELSPEQAEVFVGQMAKGAEIAGWQGPPAQLLYLAVRSDAVDVVYGTMEGFEKLGIPYLAHIEPAKPW